MTLLEMLVVAQYTATAVSAGFNMGYFWRYRSPLRRRRVGAVVMAVASLAVLIESLYFGLFVFLQGGKEAGSLSLDPRGWLLAGLLAWVGSVLISGLILRYRMKNKS